MRWVRRAVVVAAACIVTPGIVPAAVRHADARAPAGPRSEAATRPSFVLLISDDQAPSVFDRSLMPAVFSRMVDDGVLFRRAYVNSALCCPSRAEIFTGLYEHHTGVDENRIDLARPTLPMALHDRGYATALAGKYLNSWPCEARPEFDSWHCVASGMGNYSLVDPWIQDDGVWHKTTGYQPELLADDIIAFLETVPADQPLFAVYAPTTPHMPANGGRYQDMPVTPLRTSSYDQETRTPDTPQFLRRPPIQPDEATRWDGQHRQMSRATRALDDQIARILDTLDATGRTENTVVIYLSDNGYHYGEHRRTWKASPFEESVRVPMVIRYPGLAPSAFGTHALVENTDLAPTIAEFAGIAWGADGVSLIPLLTGSSRSVRDTVLIQRCRGEKFRDDPCQGQGFYPGNQTAYPAYEGAITHRHKYVRYPVSGEEQLFDLVTDPFELTNLAADPSAAGVKANMAARLDALLAPPAPETTIVEGPPARLHARQAEFTYLTQSRTASYACRLVRDGVRGPWHDCTGGSIVEGGLAEGRYRFKVRATDEWGVVDPTPASRGFRVRAGGPTITFTSTPPLAQTSGEASFGFMSDVPGATFECRLRPWGRGRPAWTACDSAAGMNYSGLGEGLWNFEVRATDPETGRKTSPPAAWMFRIDRTGPGVQLASRPLPRTTSSTATFRFVPTEAVARRIRCRLGPEPAVDCSDGEVTFSDLKAGWHGVAITMVDSLGNTATTRIDWTIDRTKPAATIVSGPPSPTSNPVPRFSLSMNEKGVLLCALDAWAPSPCAPKPILGTLEPGTHSLVVTAQDRALNVSDPVTWTWTISE